MITKTELKILFHQETGLEISDEDNSLRYYKWVEEKLLEKLNEEKQVENLFNELG